MMANQSIFQDPVARMERPAEPASSPSGSQPTRRRNRVPGWVMGGLAGTLLLGSVVGGSPGAVAANRLAPALAAAPRATAPAATPAAPANGVPTSLAALYERVSPSVVY